LYALCESSVYALIVNFFFVLQITYSVPYALISTRIESLGLGQGDHFFFYGYTYKNFLGDVCCWAAYLNKWLGSCRIINGCPESGNSDPTGMAALSFLYYMCISVTTILNGNQFIFMIDVFLYQVLG
jgi:hypothetical protein